MQDAGPAYISNQSNEIKDERNERPHVLHAQRGRQPGIHREKSYLNGGLICQVSQQPAGLDGLTADDAERWRDQKNVDRRVPDDAGILADLR